MPTKWKENIHFQVKVYHSHIEIAVIFIPKLNHNVEQRLEYELR